VGANKKVKIIVSVFKWFFSYPAKKSGERKANKKGKKNSFRRV
jgi:hypothetical protein